MAKSGCNIHTGRAGEEVARRFYESRGYRLVEKNFRVPAGEIDLVFEQSGELVFVEVKSRRSARYGLPQEAVARRKQQKIVKAALWFVERGGYDNHAMRFDVLAVLFRPDGSFEIEHIPHAFDAYDAGMDQFL